MSVRTVWVNCKDLISYQVACHLVNNFRESDEQIHTSGYPRGTIHHKLWEHIDDSDATHILFVLDEIDTLGSDDELLYQASERFCYGGRFIWRRCRERRGIQSS